MGKRLIKSCAALTLAAAMLATVPGCEKKNRSANESVSQENVANVTAPGELPIVKEKITLNIGIRDSVNVIDFETNEFTKWLEEQTGIDLQFTLFPASGYKEKLNVMLASDSELPDVLIYFNIDDATYLKYADQGTFVELDEYLDSNAYWTNQMFEKTILKEPKKWMKSANGHYYFMPYIVEQTGNIYSGKLKAFRGKQSGEIP